MNVESFGFATENHQLSRLGRNRHAMEDIAVTDDYLESWATQPDRMMLSLVRDAMPYSGDYGASTNIYILNYYFFFFGT